MRRRRYGYERRGGFSGGQGWLVFPFLLVAGVLLLNAQLPDDGDGFILGSNCSEGEECAPNFAVGQLDCAAGGACAAPRPGSGPTELGDPTPGEITGSAAAVVEAPCGAILYGHNAYERRAPASLTKIATALVALEEAEPWEIVDVHVSGAELSAETGSTVMGLEPGQRLSVRDLLYGMLLPSGNDAAIAIAEYVAGSVPAFADLMNSRVSELGLGDTHFTNPHGLDEPDLYTSAFDIATLGAELMREPELANIVSTPEYVPAWDGPSVWNGNRLLQLYPGAIGVKIGFTDDAGQTIVAAAEQDGRKIFASVLGSASIYEDAIRLLDWAFTDVPSACP